MIQRLEQDLDTPLFDRQGKSISLNQSGKIVLSYTNEILQDISSMRQLLALQKKSTSHVTVLTNLPNMIRYIFPHYQQEHSGSPVDVQYVENLPDRGELLEKGICHMLITDRPVTGRDDLESTLLYQDQMAIALPQTPEYTSRSWIDINDIPDLHLIEPQATAANQSSHLIRDFVKRHRPDYTLVPTIDIGSQDFLLKTTGYCAILSTMTTLFWCPSNAYCIPLSNPDARISYYAVFSPQLSDEARSFLIWLKNWFSWVDQMCHSRFDLSFLLK